MKPKKKDLAAWWTGSKRTPASVLNMRVVMRSLPEVDAPVMEYCSYKLSCFVCLSPSLQDLCV
jgi:hypothetical protein